MFFNACPKFGHPVRTLEIAESMAPVSMLQKKSIFESGNNFNTNTTTVRTLDRVSELTVYTTRPYKHYFRVETQP